MGGVPAPWSDVTSLSLMWNDAVGAVPPLGSDLRTALPQRWVRLHYLPDGERVPATTEQRNEVLRRYREVLGALQAAAEEELLVTTCGWARTSPAPRPRDLTELLPGTHWRDVPPKSPDDLVTSVYATSIAADVDDPALADFLLVWAADNRTADAIIAPPSCAWLFHPYDGGMDVIARDPTERDRLADRFADWRSRRPDGL